MLKLFIVCLPYLLQYLNTRQGMVARSEVDAGVIQKYFIFQAGPRLQACMCTLALALDSCCPPIPRDASSPACPVLLTHHRDRLRGRHAFSDGPASAGCCTCEALAVAQVVTVFLGSFLAGSLFSQFTAWVDHPASAVTILGTSAPLTSIFFLNYLSLSVGRAPPAAAAAAAAAAVCKAAACTLATAAWKT